MKVYFPDKQYDKYVVVEFKLGELWKRIDEISLLKFLKKFYFSKKKCQQYCDWKNAPDIDFGGILQIKDN